MRAPLAVVACLIAFGALQWLRHPGSPGPFPSPAPPTPAETRPNSGAGGDRSGRSAAPGGVCQAGCSVGSHPVEELSMAECERLLQELARGTEQAPTAALETLLFRTWIKARQSVPTTARPSGSSRIPGWARGRQPSCRLSRRLERVREPFRLALRPACVDMPLTLEPPLEAPRCAQPEAHIGSPELPAKQSPEFPPEGPAAALSEQLPHLPSEETVDELAERSTRIVDLLCLLAFLTPKIHKSNSFHPRVIAGVSGDFLPPAEKVITFWRWHPDVSRRLHGASSACQSSRGLSSNRPPRTAPGASRYWRECVGSWKRCPPHPPCRSIARRAAPLREAALPSLHHLHHTRRHPERTVSLEEDLLLYHTQTCSGS